MTDKYDDIINLPHPTSKRYPRMPLAERAAQFSPFAALTGYEEVIAETARQVERSFGPQESDREYNEHEGIPKGMADDQGW